MRWVGSAQVSTQVEDLLVYVRPKKDRDLDWVGTGIKKPNYNPPFDGPLATLYQDMDPAGAGLLMRVALLYRCCIASQMARDRRLMTISFGKVGIRAWDP